MIALRPDGTSTAVDVSGAVHTGGPIARLGQRLIGGVAKMILDRFFACLRAKLEADGAPRLLHTVRGVGYVLRQP